MDGDSSPRVKNQYNDALGYLGRINVLWYRVASSRINIEPYQWLNYLISLYQELSTQMDPKKDRPIFLKKIEDCKEHLKHPFFSDGVHIWLNQSLYDSLLDFEQSLRDTWHKSGLDMKQINIDELEDL